MSKHCIFISYAHQDEPWAKWVAWQLEFAGHTTEMMPWGPGADFADRMDTALKKCPLTIGILTVNYLRSPFCRKEYLTAWTQGVEKTRKSLVLVRVANCKPSGLLRTHTYIDLVPITEEQKARQELLKGIDGKRIRLQSPPPFPVAGPVFPAAKQEPAEPRSDLREFIKEYQPMAKDYLACRDSLRRVADGIKRGGIGGPDFRDQVQRLGDEVAAWIETFRHHFRYKPPIPEDARPKCKNCSHYYTLDSLNKQSLEESLHTIQQKIHDHLELYRPLLKKYDGNVTTYHERYDTIIDLALWPYDGNRSTLGELRGERVIIARTADEIRLVVEDSPRGRYLQGRR